MESHTADDVPYGDALAQLLTGNEEWLTRRILHHAKRQGFTRYTSTLAEAWRLSISGLTLSIVKGIEHHRGIPEILADEDTRSDPVARFGVLEAQRHRTRGISLVMFLGLYKYYQQAYLELLDRALLTDQERRLYGQFIRRIFERIEIAFCGEWSATSTDQRMAELQAMNRNLAKEKNAYLTVFESLSSPVILLGVDGRVRSLNHEAVKLLNDSAGPGAGYYIEDVDASQEPLWSPRGQSLDSLFPWLPPSSELLGDAVPGGIFECSHPFEEGTRVFEGRVSRLLDVTENQTGTVIILSDVTDHKALTERLDHLAKTDDLTGINNRRHFFELAHHETLRARRHHRELSLMVIDIDHFKDVNDTHGHGAGDDLLVGLTQTMLGTLRATDTLGRVGGEEFAIALPETGQEAARVAAERLRAGIADSLVRTAAGFLRATVSIGTATLADRDRNFEDLLRRGDQALYQAKAQGRNCVVASTEEEATAASMSSSSSGVVPRAEGPEPVARVALPRA